MTPVAMAISRALIHFVWQGSIVGLLLWTVLFALRKRSANSRYVAGCAALTVSALMPVVTAWVIYSRPKEKETAGPLTIKLAEMQKEFNDTPLPQRKIGPVVMAGRVVKRINTADLPDSVSNDLLSRLPVREGDNLSQDSIEQTAKALRAFDEHLRVHFRATDDGQVEIRIVVPR